MNVPEMNKCHVKDKNIIMPINYSKYPDNWKTEIRPRILKRANDKCECCGYYNGMEVISFKFQGKTSWIPYDDFKDKMNDIVFKIVKVILTIAHLDHDETNHQVKDDRLMAMCQLCHLRYDSEEKKRRKKEKEQKG